MNQTYAVHGELMEIDKWRLTHHAPVTDRIKGQKRKVASSSMAALVGSYRICAFCVFCSDALRIFRVHVPKPPPVPWGFLWGIVVVTSLQTLVLNADYRPLRYHPLSLWSWKDAVTALLLNRVNLVETYDRVVHSPSLEIRVPSVVSLKRYVSFQGRPAFTRYNIYLRDGFMCQYCGQTFATTDLTFDHVMPRSRGGLTRWTNVVAACAPCNVKKANRTPAEAGMPLIQEVREPSAHRLNQAARAVQTANVHHTWLDYLYWDSELRL